MFNNNQLHSQNLLSSSYLCGNILFHGNTLYSPVLNYVKCIDLANNKTSILPFQTHNQIKIIALHPQETIIVVVDVVGYAVVFNIKGMFTVAQYNFKGTVESAKFSEDGKLFAIAQGHGFIVYECPSFWRTFEPFVLLKKYKNRHSDTITNIQFSPDSRFLITCGLDNMIYINNLFPIPEYIAFTLEVHKYKIIGASYSKDMQYIYTVDTGSNVYVWKWVEDSLTEGYANLKESRLRHRNNRRSASKNNRRDQTKKQHEGQGQGQVQVQGKEQAKQSKIKQNNNKFMSDFEKKINNGRYILASKLTVTQPGAFLKRYYYDNNTGFMAAAYSNGKFTIYKLVKQEINQVQTFSVGTYKISNICANQSCTWLGLAVKSAGQIIVWEWKSQSYILSQKGLVHQSISLASYKSGKYIATGTTQGEIKLYEKSTGLNVTTFSDHDANVTDLKFSNATTLFSCSLDGLVNAYDVVKFRKFRTFKPDTKSQFNCLALDEAGEIVLAGAFDPYEIYAWNVQTSNILQIIKGHQGPISCIELAGDYLISGSWDKTLKLHQLYARKLNVQTLQHSSQITALAVHPDGKQYAAATIRGQIYIWEIEDNQLVGIIDAEVSGGRSYFSKISAQNDTNTKYLKTLAYSSCGKYLVGAGKSKYLYFYDIEHRMLMNKIELTKNRDLQGVIQKLNSKFVKDGQATYEMMLQEQQKNMSDDEEQVKLPGSKKVDISEIRTKLEVDVRKLVMIDSQSLAVCTSFGVFIYSTDLQNRSVFNPYDLDPSLTPQKIVSMIKQKQYPSALSGALSLNIPIRKLLRKIPIQNIKQTINELDSNRLGLLLSKISQNEMDFSQCLWVDQIIKISNVTTPENLLLSIGNLGQQVSLLRRIEAKLEISEIVSL